MNHLSVKRGSTNLFNIVKEDITKHSSMVDTGETYQSHSFKIKERKSDDKSTQIINPENMDQLLSFV